MKRKEAIDILETINELYPKFEITDRKVRILLPKLLDMDYDRVMKRLSDFAVEKPYPPTLAEIAAYTPEKNESLEKMKKWEEEAKQVPEETKRKFKNQLKKLIEEKGND